MDYGVQNMQNNSVHAENWKSITRDWIVLQRLGKKKNTLGIN